jgi:hypothetical protein
MYKKASTPLVVVGPGLTGGDPDGMKYALQLARLKGVAPDGYERLVLP